MSSENKAWHGITIDTVERYQGSQRDIIILSLCLNSVHQLKTMSSLMEEEGSVIDRKLNVALTRARQQIIITGNPLFMEQDAVYSDFLEYIKGKQGYVG
jgi:superfamily I DNA and/or RNA helicase